MLKWETLETGIVSKVFFFEQLNMQTNITLIRNCLNILLTQGLKVTMDDIARELGMSKRTLYEIFENKTDLIYKSVELLLSEEEKRISHYLSSNDSNIIEELFPMLNYNVYNWLKERREFLSEIKRSYPEVFEKMIAAHLDEYKMKLGEIIHKGIKQEFFRKEINVDIVKIYLFDQQMSGKQNKQLFENFPIEQIFENTLLCFVRGLCTSKGIELIEEISQRNYPYFDDKINCTKQSYTK